MSGPRTERAPLLGADTWLAVMERHGRRCTCRGECGVGHKDSRGRRTRCPSTHRETGRTADRLVAAPIDPGVGTVAAMRLPAAELTARCHDCQGGIRRIASRAAKRERLDLLVPMFDIETEAT